MCDTPDSLKQCSTPLNRLFFSDFNKNLVQRGIRQVFKNKTDIAIDFQNPDDLHALMRFVFINNSGDHYKSVNDQVRYMNIKVIEMAIGQIQTGVTQYISYTKDIDTLSTPIDQPINTSTVGKKIDIRVNKIGIN